MSARFVVSEVSGTLALSVGSNQRRTNVTVAVHDRAYGYRDVAAFRSEDLERAHGVRSYGSGGYLGDTWARRLAQEACDRLNAEYGPLEY